MSTSVRFRLATSNLRRRFLQARLGTLNCPRFASVLQRSVAFMLHIVTELVHTETIGRAVPKPGDAGGFSAPL
jgi:hypothetical protein